MRMVLVIDSYTHSFMQQQARMQCHTNWSKEFVEGGMNSESNAKHSSELDNRDGLALMSEFPL